MKKLALIIDSLDKCFPQDGKIRGGANKVSARLIENFIANPEIELHIFCGLSSVDKIEGVNDINILGFCPFSDMAGFFEKIKKLLDESSYDIVLSSDVLAPYGNIMVHSHSVIYKNKNCKPLWLTAILNILNRKKILKFQNQFTGLNQKVFAMSDMVKKDYIENTIFDESSIFAVYPGADEPKNLTRRQNKVCTFGIVAGSAINKGGHMFVAALWLLSLKNNNFKAKIIHSKYKKDVLMKFLLSLFNLGKRVEILDYNVDMDEFYNELDCLVMPSVNEAFGLVLLEAASYFVPTVASSTAGSAELLQDGKNGFIFRRQKHGIFNLAAKMNTVLNLFYKDKNRYKEICANAQELSATYTWKRFADEVWEILTTR
ncbi:MAG: glycosyltransferase family 4 protein [Candidatus Gastranaerophilales bacterium]|nr:glycosyltransferase family 4 protein [Candidatus Gastranaerophilales bacterium]